MSADTRSNIMEAAKAVVQTHGYSAISFREIAKTIGVKSASVHYHFPTKGDLGASLARQYADEAQEFLDSLPLDRSSIKATVRSYTNAFRAALERDNRMCLCGIMIAEYDELPEIVRIEVKRFTTVNIGWLERLLTASGFDGSTKDREKRAFAVFSAVEGAQLIARGQTDLNTFDASIEAFIDVGLLPN